MSKSWAEKHPIITGALVGSVVPGIGTLAGALGGVIYDITTRIEENGKPEPVPEENGRPGPPPAEPVE
jgi:hypothetical protein